MQVIYCGSVIFLSNLPGMNERMAVLLLWCILFPLFAAAQTATPKKEINDQWQSWTSLNSTFRFSHHWGAIADIHIRRSNFVADPNFYFLRGGGGYWLNDNLSFIAGYAHMWLAPSQPGGSTWSNENRLYEQIAYASSIGKVSILHRFRDEHRWREQVTNDKSTGNYNFSNRLRYLISIGIPVSANKWVPQISIANEVAVQFGKAIVNNTFDQIRLFAGIRQILGHGFAFDAGYMLLYQQKASGYQYDRNHTARLFFYYNFDTRTKKNRNDIPLMYEDE